MDLGSEHYSQCFMSCIKILRLISTNFDIRSCSWYKNEQNFVTGAEFSVFIMGPSIKKDRTRGRGGWGVLVSQKRTHGDVGGGGRRKKADFLKFRFLPTFSK